MGKRVVASLLSFLLAFTLLLPMAGAEGGAAEAIGGRKVTSRLNPDVMTQEALKANRNIRLQDKKAQGAFEGAAASSAGKGLTLKRQDADPSAVQPQSFVPFTDSSESITVIVELQEEPVKVFEAGSGKKRASRSMASHKQAIQIQQKSFKQQAVGTLNAKVRREFSGIFNGFSLKLPANQVESLLQLPGVKAVYPNNTVYATAEEETPSAPQLSVPFIGSGEFWEQGIKGQGMKVGVIDTGVANDHPDLAGAVADGDWGYDFVNNDNKPYETTKEDYYEALKKDPTLPEVNEDGRPYWTSHGSHVSGIVAGRNAGVDALEGIEGVAPEAEIHAYKVLGPYGSGTTENVIAGIEKAVEDGMDVINLSLGSDGNNQQSADSIAVNNAMKAGVIAVVSSGNSGPAEASVGDPGSSELAITVGASKPPLVTPIMKVPEMAGAEFFMETFDKSAGIEDLTESYPLVAVGLGKAADYAGKDLTGKIAYIKRGEISFAEKALNANASGAVAAIVFNNAPEALESGTLGDAEVTIPVYSLSGAYGERILAALQKQALTAEFSSTVEADTMAGFSSRGPAKPAYDIKPDIAAPGISIRSSVPEYEGWYEAQNGTSMAAPHVAGAAALLAQAYPELTPYEIKSLMMNNALKLFDRNGNRYTHMDQGAGRIALDRVLAAKAVAMAEDTTEFVDGDAPETFYSGSLSFGYVGYGSTAERDVIVKDVAGEASSYSISSRWYGDAPVGLTLSTRQVTVGAGEETSFTVAVEAPEEAVSQRYEGEVTLTEASTGHVINMPVSVYVGEAPQVDIVSDAALSNNPFSPNGDTVYDTTDITFTINEYTEYFSLDAHSLNGEWIGTIFETTDGISPGSYTLGGWDGTVFTGLDDESLPDDGYLLVPYAGPSFEASLPVEDQAAVFFVDTEAPESRLDDPAIKVNASDLTGTISGEVTQDLLINYLVTLGGMPMSDVIGAAAVYDTDGDGEWEQSDGVIDDKGHFKIEVPVVPGDNHYEVYVYDLAGNGLLLPVDVVEYNLTGYVSPVVVPAQLQANEPFTLDVRFSVTDAVYAAAFNLLYSGELGEVAASPSPELESYQQTHDPEVPLTVSEAVYGHGDGLMRYEFMESLSGGDGYVGEGSLATFTFAGAPAGKYTFTLTNLTLYDKDGNELPVTWNRRASLTVQEPVEQPAGELVVEPKALSLKEGASDQLTVTYKDADGTATNVTDAVYYTPENPQIVTVSKGTVTALKAGTTSIGISYEGLTELIAVTVTPAAAPGNGGGGGSGGGGGGGTNSTISPSTPESPANRAVKVAIRAGEPTVVKLPNGFALTIPAGAIPSPEAAFVQVTPALEPETKALLDNLKLGAGIHPFGIYYDLAILTKDGKPLENVAFGKPAEAAIPLTALNPGAINGEKISLFKLGEQGQLTQYAGRLVDGKVVARLHGFSRYMYLAKDISFADVTAANYPWAVNEIEILASKEIVAGTNEGTFDPGSQVTRAEFISLLVRALELRPDEIAVSEVSFSDVPGGSWFEEAVKIAASKGIISGYEGGIFAPDRSITRAEMAVVLSRALDALGRSPETAEELAGFADQERIPGWASEAVAAVTGLGIMKGKAGDRFEAEQPTTRAEAAVVVYRMYKGFAE